MTADRSIHAKNLFIILSGIFIAALVTSNLIFQKFFTWNPFGLFNFEISVGIIPYPITFLATDIISEIFGKKSANRVVMGGLFASLFTLIIVFIADVSQATEWSPIGNEIFSHVFGRTFIAVGASMAAYLLAQLIDVQLFHFWKKLTKGQHLWLRNNASTFTSQLVDTATVLLLLCTFDVIDWNLFWILLGNGFLFKILVALLDTPIIYIVLYFVRKHFKLQSPQEELQF